eukprot:COSAG05_NODE_6528_length_943_cov_0.914692_1_plen_85_part_01
MEFLTRAVVLTLACCCCAVVPRRRVTANPSLNLPKDWALLCTIAYKQQISLGALGFYASPFGGAYRWRTHEEIDDLSKAAANEHR